jgi:uncharacterized NAD(P)/FAD-binding protein YdhS
VLLSDGRRIDAARVALALGNPPPRRSPVRGDSAAPFVDDPWEAGALDSLPARGTVLVLGAGLTMIDVVLAMDAAGHRGTVHAVSRRGFLPRTHATSPLAPTAPPAPAASTALAWLRAFRAEVAAGADARGVVDALRPTTAAAWRALPARERERFLRHIRPLWDSVRHRTAPSVGRAIQARILDGRLVVHRGRIASLTAGPHGARAEIRLRWGGGTRIVDAVAIVNATGPDGDPAADPRPLVRSLLLSGVACRHPLGLGFDATPDGDLVGADGIASEVVATLGPPLRGVLWESTAVPEIRAQATALARRWLSRGPG